MANGKRAMPSESSGATAGRGDIRLPHVQAQHKSDHHQQIPEDRNNPMCADRSIRCRPRKHEDAIDRHELLGPEEAGNAKYKVQLHNDEKQQIFHVGDSGNDHFTLNRAASGSRGLHSRNIFKGPDAVTIGQIGRRCMRARAACSLRFPLPIHLPSRVVQLPP